MKITCPACARITDLGDVPNVLLASIGSGSLTVRCPRCGVEIELAPELVAPELVATLSIAGKTVTWTPRRRVPLPN